MKPEEQRIAIAEACGWVVLEDGYWTHPDFEKRKKYGCGVCPDYLNDLNAMHEAEVLLENEIATADKYWTTLAELTGADDDELGTVTRYRYIGNATAAQKAEAFLKAMGTWEDEE